MPVVTRFTRTLQVCFVIMSLVPVVWTQSKTSVPRSDNQLWNELQITIPVRKSVGLVVGGQLRIGRNFSDLFDKRFNVTLNFKTGKYLTLSPGFQHSSTESVSGLRSSETDYRFSVTPRFTFQGFTFHDRNMVERRVRLPVNSVRYRNRVGIERALEFGGNQYLLFALDEVSRDRQVYGGWRNRFTIGGSRAFNRHLTGEVYYLRQSEARGLNGDLNVIGTALRVRVF